MRIQRPCQRRGRQHRNPRLARDGLNAHRQLVQSLGHDARRPPGCLVITDCHRIMRRVDHHNVRRWDRRQHPPTSGLTLSRTYLSLQLRVPFRLAVLPLGLVPGHSQVGPVSEPLERHVEERQREEQQHREPQPPHHQSHGMAHRTRQGPMRERGKLGEAVHGIPAADGPQQAGQQRQLQELHQVPEREDALETAGRTDA